MKQLPVRFSHKQTFQIDDLAEKTGVDKSQVARAAMQIGLKAIRDHESDQLNQAEFVAINNLKALN